MSRLPTGTVTLLFTDIEGSTRLLQELGDAYADVLAQHRHLLREAFARHDGVEVDTQGDAFFYAFGRATDAAAAAGEAQRALAAGPVRVRMGVHTGEPRVTDQGYVGADVHRAARIMGAGHGGQVLVSETTRGLLDSHVELRDLGRHRLKDLETPEHIFQLGSGSFPPLKSLNNTNLPLQLEPLLGRKRELAELLRLIRRERVRLVALTGAGGIGKTRLALELASELVGDFAHGVWFVDLSPVRQADLVESTIAGVLGARGSVVEHIGDRSVALVLDNFEQVVEAAPTVARLPAACRELVLVVTSREPLHVAGERQYPLRPLAEAPAVELFRRRAESAVPDFGASYGELAEICARLDALPLAIELAAAHAKSLGAAELRSRLERRLPLLSKGRRDAPARQRTLRATIEWSFDLLPAAEQSAFVRLGTFAGAWTADAAEAVAAVGFDLNEALVDKSLVRHERGRYWFLETIREYASELLDGAGELDALRRQHADYFAERARRLGEAMRTPDRAAVVADLRAEFPDIRAAVAFERGRDVQRAVEIVVSLRDLWATQGYAAEARALLAPLLDDETLADSTTRARALATLGNIAHLQGDFDLSRSCGEQWLAIARASGDEGAAARALSALGSVALLQGDHERAFDLHRQALEIGRRLNDEHTVAIAVGNLSYAALAVGRYDDAIEYAHESMDLDAQLGDPDGVVTDRFNLALGLFRLGREAEAAEAFRRCAEEASALGAQHTLSYALDGAAAVALARGDPVRALRLSSAAERLRRDAGLRAEPLEAALGEETLRRAEVALGSERAAAVAADAATLSLDAILAEARLVA